MKAWEIDLFPPLLRLPGMVVMERVHQLLRIPNVCYWLPTCTFIHVSGPLYKISKFPKAPFAVKKVINFPLFPVADIRQVKSF